MVIDIVVLMVGPQSQTNTMMKPKLALYSITMSDIKSIDEIIGLTSTDGDDEAGHHGEEVSLDGTGRIEEMVAMLRTLTMNFSDMDRRLS